MTHCFTSFFDDSRNVLIILKTDRQTFIYTRVESMLEEIKVFLERRSMLQIDFSQKCFNRFPRSVSLLKIFLVKRVYINGEIKVAMDISGNNNQMLLLMYD